MCSDAFSRIWISPLATMGRVRSGESRMSLRASLALEGSALQRKMLSWIVGTDRPPDNFTNTSGLPPHILVSLVSPPAWRIVEGSRKIERWISMSSFCRRREGEGGLSHERMFLDLFIIIVFLTLFLICYFSVLNNDYGFADDYSDILPEHRERIIRKKNMEGRPLYALLTKFGFPTTANIEDLRYVRFVGIVGISLLAFVQFQALVHVGWKPFQSFCVAMIICTSLPFQVFAAWAMASVFPIAGVLSACALLLAERAFSRARPVKWFLASMAVLVLVGALAIYQPAAMIFWFFAAIFLFRPGQSLNDTAARFLHYGLVGLMGMGLGFMLYKLASIFYSATSRTGLAQNFLDKAVFLYELMPRILNFALLAPRRQFYQGQGYSIQDYSILYARTFDDSIITLFLLSFMIVGLVMFFRSSRIERFLKCLMALAIFLFCCTPFLIVEESRTGYRLLAAPVSLVILYLYFAFQGWTRLFSVPSSLRNAALGVSAGVALLLAAYHVHNWLVVPHVKELKILSYPLTHDNLSHAERIVVVRPAYFWSETFAPFVWEEFGSSSAYMRFNHSAMIHVLLSRMAQDPNSFPPIVAIPANGSIDPLPGDLVVDMTNFRTRLSLYQWIRSETCRTPIISGPFQVYLDKDRLYYTKSPCTLEDVTDRFFLHVAPIEGDDLSKGRKQHGFDNLDFDWHGVTYNERCFAAVHLPDYSIAQIRTGQFTVTDMKSLWEGTWFP